jgi:hypothetical protein
MTTLDAYRRGLALRYADDILLCLGAPAREIAERNGVPLTVALRVLVPHFTAKGLSAREIAGHLDISERAVVRHRARTRVH